MLKIKIIKYFFAVFICFLLFVPMIVQIFHLDPTSEEDFIKVEKRKPHKLKIKSAKSLPDDFEKWFNDNYGLRSVLIGTYATTMYQIFNTTIDPNNTVAGKNGYLYLGNNYKKVVEQSRNILNFNDGRLNQWYKLMLYFKEIAENNNSKLYFTVAPNKHGIYPENGPNYFLLKDDKKDSYSQLYENLMNTKVPLIELKKYLISLKNVYKNFLYHKTDTHWSSLGAFKAYEKIMSYIKKDFNNLKFLKVKSYKITNCEGYDLVDLSKINHKVINDFKTIMPSYQWTFDAKCFDHVSNKEYPCQIYNGSLVLTISNTHALNNLNVLVYGDSFTSPIIPLYTKTFKTVTYLHHRFLFDEKFGINNFISKIKPDVIIFEIVERQIITRFDWLPEYVLNP